MVTTNYHTMVFDESGNMITSSSNVSTTHVKNNAAIVQSTSSTTYPPNGTEVTLSKWDSTNHVYSGSIENTTTTTKNIGAKAYFTNKYLFTTYYYVLKGVSRVLPTSVSSGTYTLYTSSVDNTYKYARIATNSSNTDIYFIYQRVNAVTFSIKSAGHSTLTAVTPLQTVTGSAAGSTISGWLESGTSLKLTATMSTGYSFSGWVDGDGNVVSNNSTYTFSPTSTVNLTATESSAGTYTVTFNKNGGSDLCSVYPESISNVPSGSTVTRSSNKITINGTTVTATSLDSEWVFDSWSNVPSTITANRTITANFSSTTCTVTFSISSGSAYGSISTTSITVPRGTTYTSTDFGSTLVFTNEGTQVGGVSATPNPSTSTYIYSFNGWSSTSGTITSDTTISCSFSRTRIYTVSFVAGAGGSVSQSSIGSVPSGSSISVSGNTVTINGTTVTATASSGCTFSSWSNVSGTIISNRTITANFNLTINLGVDASYTGCSMTVTASGYSSVTVAAGETKSITVVVGTQVTFSATLDDSLWNFVAFRSLQGYISQTNPFTLDTSSIQPPVVNLVLSKKTTYTYTIKFYSNGGSGSMPTKTIESTDDPYDYIVPECTFTPPSGKTFYRWELDEAEGMTAYFDPGDNINKYGSVLTSSSPNHSLWAIWKNVDQTIYKSDGSTQWYSSTIADPNYMIICRNFTNPDDVVWSCDNSNVIITKTTDGSLAPTERAAYVNFRASFEGNITITCTEGSESASLLIPILKGMGAYNIPSSIDAVVSTAKSFTITYTPTDVSDEAKLEYVASTSSGISSASFGTPSGGTIIASVTPGSVAGNNTLGLRMNHAPYKPFSINVKTYLVVTFDPNGSGATVSPTTKNAFPGETYGDLPTPIREGYAFTGWYTESTGGTLVSADTIVSSNTSHKLYAHWDLAGYDVIIHSQAETGNIKLNGTVINFGSETSKTFRLTATSFTLEYIQTDLDYSFDKWHVTFPDDFGPDVYEEYTSNPATIPLETTTEVYVILKNSTYVVTFDAETNGGTLVGNRQITVTAGQTYGDGGEFPTATKEGYTFSGWFTQASGGTRITESTRVALTKDQTLYAQFGECTITLNRPTNGSMYYNGTLVVFTSSTVSYKIPEGQRTVLKAVPDEGYVFDRWTFVLQESGVEDYSLAAETTEYIYEDWDIYVDFKIDEDDPDERESEELPAGVPRVLDRCYLAFYPDSSSMTPTAVLNLLNIQSIEENDTAVLTEISTVIYGFEDNFCMDTGTVQKYTVTLERTQVADADDTGDFSNQANWSNGHWFNMLKFFIERWQNLNYGVFNGSNVRTGGFRFHFEPGKEDKRSGVSYSDLYPVIDKYVFVLGSVSMSMSDSNLQYIRVTIPLTVGSMVRLTQSSSSSGHAVTYALNSGSSVRMTMTYPEDMDYPVANVPLSWFIDYRTTIGLKTFDYWLAGSTPKYPGEIASSDISSMAGHWVDPELVFDVKYGMSETSMLSKESDSEYRLTSAGKSRISSASRVRIWVVSGGGGGGGGYYSNQMGIINTGGGGGSGGFFTGSFGFTATDLDTIIFQVGNGGSGGSENGDSGGNTSITMQYGSSSTQITNIPGGSGGKRGKLGGNGAGGAGSPIGGSAGSDAKGLRGGDGGTPVQLPLELGSGYTIDSVGGTGGTKADGGDGRGYGAGGGGAAPNQTGGTSIKYGGDGAPGYILIAFYR